LFRRASWWLIQFFEFIKDDCEVFVVYRQLANNGRELSIKFFVRFQLCRSITKARLIAMLTAMARSLLRTLDSIATPCSVKA
jgi:hypothetical protein